MGARLFVLCGGGGVGGGVGGGGESAARVRQECGLPTPCLTPPPRPCVLQAGATKEALWLMPLTARHTHGPELHGTSCVVKLITNYG